MGKEIISRFRETPKTKIGRWAMWLGLSPIIAVPFLGIFVSVIRPFIDRVSNESLGAAFGFSIVILFIALSVSALTAAIISYRKGEHSWCIWVGFVPTIFLLFMLIGEFVFPH
jgi:hypothetical protein